MEIPKNQERANRWLRYLGTFFLFWAGLGLWIKLFTWPSASSMIAGALFMLLFVPERVNDERVKQLKLKAITWGYVGGLVLVVIYENIGRSILRVKTLPVFSAFDVLIILTALALGLFRWWRWQDGRAQALA
jgi:hypothetical protein